MKTARWLVLLSLCAGLWPGCQCGHLEIGAAGRVVPGQFRAVWGFPWGDHQRYLLADRLDATGEPTGATTVVVVENWKTCNLQIEEPHWFFSMGDDLFAFEAIDWNNWTGRLIQIPLPCGPPRTLVEDVLLDLWTSPEQDRLVVLGDVDSQTWKGTLKEIRWPEGTITDGPTGITYWPFVFEHPDQRFFHVEDGVLVVSNFDGTEVGRMGNGVTSIASNGKGELLFQEHPKLYRGTIDGSDVALLSENGCAAAFGEATVTYVAPCGFEPGRALVALDRETWAPIGRWGNGVGRFHAYPTGWLSWLEDQTDLNAPGTLWVKPPDREPVKVAERVPASWYIIPELGLVLHPQVDAEGKTSLLSSDVVAHTSQVLAEDVDPGLAIAQSPWSIHVALVSKLRAGASVDGGTPERLGDLELVHPKGTERLLLASGVPVNGFRFSWQAPAIGYLKDFQAHAAAGSLEVLSMLDRKVFSVDDEVVEFTEVFAPKRGVAYVIRDPIRAGIYFAEALVSLF